MSRAQQLLGVGLLVAVALGLGYAGLRITSDSRVEVCQACGRAIHANMRTIALLGDQREMFCCPTCALSAGAQLNEPVRFVQVTDYETARPLRPADAVAVEGSDVIPCVRSHEMRNRDGQPVPLQFDRCSPSIIAFANRSVAERFAADHGGKVDAFLQVVARATATAVH